MAGSPYAKAADDYFTKGWWAMPITSPGEKHPVPAGYTGKAGAPVTSRDTSTWKAMYGEGGYNIAVRVTPDMVGIDVDAYGEKPGARTLAEWEAAVGSPLPPTFRSSARLATDTISGIRFYRLAEGVSTESWVGGAPGIEFIRHSHRYAVVSPSLNPNADGAQYRWLCEWSGEICEAPPSVSELSILPAEWAAFFGGLSHPERTGDSVPLPPSTDDRCGVIEQEIQIAMNEIAAGGARHDVIYSSVKKIHYYAREGHQGHEQALAILKKRLFEERVTKDGKDERVVSGEWSRMIQGAKDKVAHVKQEESCWCRDDALMEWVNGTVTGVSEQFEKGEETAAGEQAEETVKEPYKSRFRSGGDVIQNTEIPWLVEGVVHQRGLGQLSAPEDTGKSIIMVGLALSVANGLDEWAGYKINRSGPVVYVAMEGGPVIQTYIDAWLVAHPGCDLEQFYLLDEEVLDFTDKESVDLLQKDIEAEGINPVLMVFDTQIDVTGGTDEMLPEMGQLLSKVRMWLVHRDCFGMLLHHPPYGQKRGRGSTSVRGKADVLWFADKDDSKIEWQKVKGAKKPAKFKFEIVPVPGSSGAVAEFPGAPGLADLAETEAAAEGSDAAEKDRRTELAILEILRGDSPRMADGKASGWSNAEIGRALDALSSRATEDGGPMDVHTHKTYFGDAIDRLAAAGRIVDHAVSWSSGKQREWGLNREQS